MWEGNNEPLWQASPTSATSTTVTFANLTSAPLTNYATEEAVIVSGTGMGQNRMITAENGQTITVSPPWNIIPDTTSVMILTYGLSNVAVYDNYFGAKSYAPTNASCIASVGCEPYGNATDVVVDDNIMHWTRIRHFQLGDGAGYPAGRAAG